MGSKSRKCFPKTMLIKTIFLKPGSYATLVRKESWQKANSLFLWTWSIIPTFLTHWRNKWKTWFIKLKRHVVTKEPQLNQQTKEPHLHQFLLKRKKTRLMHSISLEMKVCSWRTILKSKIYQSRQFIKTHRMYFQSRLRHWLHQQQSLHQQARKSLKVWAKTHCNYWKESKT